LKTTALPQGQREFKVTASEGYFGRMLRGELPAPPVSILLGGQIEAVDAEAGTLRIRYEGMEAFRNPAGNIAGGLLSAMLDDLTACAVDATLGPNDAVVTLSLNVSFLRPAHVGAVHGHANLVRRGRELCHVNGMLQQDGKDVAWAVAICKIIPRPEET
jgi:uncharacterized protein (TIGR00369 family)